MYWIVSPTYQQGKDIHWKQGFNVEMPMDWIFKKNEAELEILLKNGSIIALKSAENPDRLKGVKLHGLVVDEIASIRNWEWVWNEALRPTLTDYESPAIFISTPKGFNHFYELFNEEKKNPKLYKSFHFTSYNNPYLPAGELEQAQKELSEDLFAQEYLADFRKFIGLIYKAFNKEIHVIEPFTIDSTWQIIRCLDFGSTNPTVCIWIAVDNDGNWYVIDEHYETGQTIDYHAGIINSNPYSPRAIATYGDPSGAQWIKEFRDRGVYITPANKEGGTTMTHWVRAGIEKVAAMLKPVYGKVVPHLDMSGKLMMPSFFVFSHCLNTIREFEIYRWKERSVLVSQDLNQPDTPEKANDHAMDAIRYAAISFSPSKEFIPLKSDISNKNWAII
jgi:hypothetical protein